MIIPIHNRDYSLPLQGRWYPIIPSRVWTYIRGMYAALIDPTSKVTAEYILMWDSDVIPLKLPLVTNTTGFDRLSEALAAVSQPSPHRTDPQMVQGMYSCLPLYIYYALHESLSSLPCDIAACAGNTQKIFCFHKSKGNKMWIASTYHILASPVSWLVPQADTDC